MRSSVDIRNAFLSYFNEHEHTVVPTSPLVPGNDPTLLFTNAGMVQFKDVFLGEDKRSYKRAVSVQRCVRAGGKHNDLENVGYTARHHTFFEMLGNFSFGDYFKRDAIKFGWEFLTEVCKLPADRLWVTVFEEDDEAAKIWLDEIGLDPNKFSRIGAKDNFWSMGDTGPCGPCTEIFYDHGEDIPGGPPGTPDEDGDRYIEIWNLVFMQYDRDLNGNLKPLPKPSVDTGMGLERLAAIMQGVHSNYEIDLFQSLIKAAAKATNCDDLNNDSLKVIADHIRSCAFLVVDGVVPSNEGRGYVLRRIIRRAIRHGHKLGMRQPFFHKLVVTLNEQMGDAYPELSKAQSQVERVLLQEEERFAETLDTGMEILENALKSLQEKTIAGNIVFKLYDTYGFPVDLTADIARERDLRVDMEGFNREMEAQRERARAASHFGSVHSDGLEIETKTEFTGYDALSAKGVISALYINNHPSAQIKQNEEGIIVMAQTPFYAESGGQVGDKGTICKDNAVFEVADTQKAGDAYLHIGRVVSGTLTVNDDVEVEVNPNARRDTACHHSATHLLHAALRSVLGDHVQQRGSMVNDRRLRFDFTHFEAMSAQELAAVETMVNDKIRENILVETHLMDIDDAKALGAMALFGEKYGDEVRVLKMDDFSIELCGGTHVKRTGDIGLLKVVAEMGVAAGVRRIEAVCGVQALKWINSLDQEMDQVAALVKSGRDDVSSKIKQLVDKNRHLEKELEQLKSKLASSQGDDLANQAIAINDIQVLAARLDGADPKGLRDTVDQLKNKLQKAVVILAAVNGDKISLVAGVTKNETTQVKAGDLLKSVAEQIGGKGGGRPDMAQGGGNQPENLDTALKSVKTWVESQLN